MKTSAALALSAAILAVPAAARAGHDHAIGAFAGARTAGDETNPVAGIEYEYNLFPLVGLAAFAERAFADEAIDAVGAGLAVHPIPLFGLKIVGLAGAELVGGETERLLRAGAAYEFSLGPVFAGPAGYVDFVAGHRAYLYGIVAGLGF